jgi:N,N'-diacetyllegionaminate synthase
MKSLLREFSVIAEIGSVHDGSFGNACKLIEAVADCGADVVKFQTHISQAETLPNAPMPPYFKGEPRFEYFERTAFTRSQWEGVRDVCKKSSISFLSSPFSIEAVELLELVGVDVYKIPSGEVTNLPMLEVIADTGKQVLLSSGMSDWKELDAAVDTLGRGGPLCVMQCTSAYPCPPARVGLNVIGEMRERYGLPVGFSDHTLGCAAAFAAAALGATVIEKHFTFSRLMYGSDAAHSMEPDEFKEFCSGLREIWAMLDHPVDKSDLEPYREMKQIFEKSIVAAKDIEAGEVIESKSLAFKKPGTGVSASEYCKIIGRKVTRKLQRDEQIALTDLEQV